MERINALLYVKSESPFTYLRDWISGDMPDFNCSSTDDKETFITMIVNRYPDVLFIEESLCRGLDFVDNMRKENILTPFVLLLDSFDETSVARIARLGGLNFILRSDDIHTVRHKLVLVKHLVLDTRCRLLESDGPISRAGCDELTDVPGRQEFMHMLRNGDEKSLILLDIDDFGLVNDTYGIATGDKLLAKAALAVKSLVPPGAAMFRISGDEFAIVIPNPDDDCEIRLVRKIRNAFARERFSVENLELGVTFTMGVASGRDSSTLQKADIALRRAREIGRNRYEEYRHDPELERRQCENLEWAQKISRAIECDRFFPVFQPIVDNEDGKIVMYECLARLADDGRVIEPAAFLEPANRSGLMPRVTRAMIDKSFAAFGENDFGFSINICEPDLRDEYLVGYVRDKLSEYSILPGRLIVEISEGVQSLQRQSDIDQILRLKELGIRIAFDDFGKGNSNFSRILDLMPDFIKIDGSFIRHLDRNGRGFKISHAITQFGKSIDSRVIAEFVHSKDIQERVLRLDVRYSQGYYFGKPVRTISGKTGNE